MDAPWRRPFVESSTREVNQHVTENDPIQGQEADNLGKEFKLQNALDIEDSSKSLVSEAAESEDSVDPEKVSQESSKPPCDVHDQNETKFTHPSEGSEGVDKEGPEEQPLECREASHLSSRESSDAQDRSPSKADNIVKTGKVPGKKKKSKKLPLEVTNK